MSSVASPPLIDSRCQLCHDMATRFQDMEASIFLGGAMQQCHTMTQQVYAYLKQYDITAAMALMEPFLGGGPERRNCFLATLAAQPSLTLRTAEAMTIATNLDSDLWKLGDRLHALGIPVISFDDHTYSTSADGLTRVAHDALQHLRKFQVPTAWTSLLMSGDQSLPLSGERIRAVLGHGSNGFGVFSLHHPIVLRQRELVVSSVDGAIELQTSMHLHTSGGLRLLFESGTGLFENGIGCLEIRDAALFVNKDAVHGLLSQFDPKSSALTLARRRVFFRANLDDGVVTSCRLAA